MNPWTRLARDGQVCQIGGGVHGSRVDSVFARRFTATTGKALPDRPSVSIAAKESFKLIVICGGMEIIGILAVLWMSASVATVIYGLQHTEPKYLVGGLIALVLVGVF